MLAGATAASWWSDASFAPPGGGEPLAAVVRRVAPLLDACGEGATTVLVCHQGTILAILMALLGYGLPAARAIALPPGVAVVLRRWADGGSCLDAVVPPTGILRSRQVGRAAAGARPRKVRTPQGRVVGNAHPG